jgi:endogenous inhibitor of DNA gyrase (YacG/DUF329 family)
MNVPCPTCKNEVEWSQENAYRPFCSERCKLLDLGAWAMEKHAIPVDHSAPENSDDLPAKDSDEDSEK